MGVHPTYTVMNGADMINESKRKGLHKESIEKNVEVPIRRRTIVLLAALGFTVATIIGAWYLSQLPLMEGNAGEGHQIIIFTISDLYSTDHPADEHLGTLAANFSLTDQNGSSSWLSDFIGKVVVIDFMATWCGPCRQQLPHLKVIWEKEDYSDKIVLMSIDIDPTESAETLRSFAQGFPYATWIWARDTANLGQAYQVAGIPKTVIIDQDDYIRFTHTGVTYASTFIEKIDQLLG